MDKNKKPSKEYKAACEAFLDSFANDYIKKLNSEVSKTTKGYKIVKKTK